MNFYRFTLMVSFSFIILFNQNAAADYLKHSHKSNIVTSAGPMKFSSDIIEDVTTVDSRKAKELFDREVIFIDTRKLSDWNAGRIPGAIHMDHTKEFTKENLKKIVNYHDSFVIYCNGSKCLRSEKAAKNAVEWGYKKIYYYREGFPAWYINNNPVE